MTSDSLPAPPVYKWPDTEVDSVAVELALEELTEEAPMSAILQRAQAIKEELLRTATAGAN